MAAKQDGFVPASTSSSWYKNLKRDGSCLRLYDLLAERRELIHELGPEGITVLHKGVQHGCVKLVRFILVDMFDGDGKCTCSRCGAENACVLTREGLLRKTCDYESTAVNMAVVNGSPKMVLLLKWAIDESERCKKRALAEEDLSRQVEGTDLDWYLPNMRSRFLGERAGSSGEEEATEITNDAGIDLEVTSDAGIDLEVTSDAGIDLEVPDVRDDAIGENIYGADRSNKIMKVYELIEEKLNKNWGDDQELLTMLMDMCKENVDFEFVPIAHIFLHFLLSISTYGIFGYYRDSSFDSFREKILKDILVACSEFEEGNRGSMLVTLFEILDPRGRTILHVALHNGQRAYIYEILEILREIEETSKPPLPSKRIRECVNAKDGAGRTILHVACIYDLRLLMTGSPSFDGFYGLYSAWLSGQLDWEVILSPHCCEELEALKLWCFPHYLSRALEKNYDYIPIHLAVVFNSTSVLESTRVLAVKGVKGVHSHINVTYAPRKDFDGNRIHRPFQIAAFLGRVTFIDHFLRNYTKSQCIEDGGLNINYCKQCLPAIHCAALSGQVETIQTILKYPVYDPIIQDENEGTALHLLLNMRDFRMELERFKILALLHVLPNSGAYLRVKHDFHKLDVAETEARMFSNDEVCCINLLLQAGIDLWTPSVGHHTKGRPTVGPKANNDARKWWYDKLGKEVVTQKTSITSAANATSVIGALVATTSIIGPLQPPLSYTGYGGYIDTTRLPVRAYLVCNSLSFFFSIASILMAVLPAIPMPNESMYDELLRSQRCLKAAALMLLIAIICTLIGFSCASIAVVSPERSDKQLAGVCVVVGGGVCLVVLVIYIIRLLRMLFHKNDRFRRRFAKYMYF